MLYTLTIRRNKMNIAVNTIKELDVIKELGALNYDYVSILAYIFAFTICSLSLAWSAHALSNINLWGNIADNPQAYKDLGFMPMLMIGGMELSVVFQLLNIIFIGVVLEDAWRIVAISIVSFGLAYTSYGISNNALWKAASRNPVIMNHIGFISLLSILGQELTVLGHFLISVFIMLKAI